MKKLIAAIEARVFEGFDNGRIKTEGKWYSWGISGKFESGMWRDEVNKYDVKDSLDNLVLSCGMDVDDMKFRRI